MNGKRFITTSLAFAAVAGLAAGGDITIGQKLAGGVSVYNRDVMLGCGDVSCLAGPSGLSFTSLSDSTASNASSISYALPSENYGQLTTLSGLNFQPTLSTTTTAADSNSTSPVVDMTASTAQDVNADAFVMANGTITPISTSTAATASSTFTDPIVSATFNTNSTSIAASTPDPSMPFSTPVLSVTVVNSPPSTSNNTNTNTSSNTNSNAGFTTTSNAGLAPGSTVPGPSTGDGARLSVTLDPTNLAPMGTLSTPEPNSELLIGAGLVALAAFARIRRVNNNR